MIDLCMIIPQLKLVCLRMGDLDGQLWTPPTFW